MTILNVNNLIKKFGDKTAVSVPDFAINSGDILGLVGNNGAGKTTLFRLMLDLIKSDEGMVEYHLPKAATEEGEEPHDDNATIAVNPAESEEWKQYVGSYIDDGFLIDFLTPEEYFEFILKVRGKKISAKAAEGEEGSLNSYLAPYESFMAGEIIGQKKLIRDFSAGNKQKIGIIAAMLASPKVLILDEPFNFLDPSSQNILKKMLLEYHSEHGATILVSSHNLQHTIEISSRVCLLEHGSIIKDLKNVEQSAEKELEDYFKV
ncbi:MAG: ABC transporter ATP-binding protein [Prevotella sp.]|nr:ABC transporter ATP-binding protein [Prevotella sp.]